MQPVINAIGQADRAAQKFGQTIRQNFGRGGAGGIGGGIGGGVADELAGGMIGGVGRAGAGAASGLVKQLGFAFGIGAAFGIAQSIRGAITFNTAQLATTAGMGVSPGAMAGWNKSITSVRGGMSYRLGISKEQLAQSMGILGGESDMSRAQREKLYTDTSLTDTAYQLFRGRGVSPTAGMGAEARLIKTFNLGPESVEVLAKGLIRGADQSKLARTEDFVRYAQRAAEGMAGFKGTANEMLALTASIQSGAGQAYRGEVAAGLQRSIQQQVESWITTQGGGMTPWMRSISMTALGRGPRGAYEMGMPRASASLLAEMLRRGQGFAPHARPFMYSQWAGQSSSDAFILDTMSQDKGFIKRLEDLAAGRTQATDWKSWMAGEQKRFDAMAGSKEFKGEQAGILASNISYGLANQALNALTGNLKAASGALLIWTASLAIPGMIGMGRIGAGAAGGGMLARLFGAGAAGVGGRAAMGAMIPEAEAAAMVGAQLTRKSAAGTAASFFTTRMAAGGLAGSLFRVIPIVGLFYTAFEVAMYGIKKWEGEVDSMNERLQNMFQTDMPGNPNQAQVAVGLDRFGNPIYEQAGTTSDKNNQRVSWWHQMTGLYPMGEAREKMKKLKAQQDAMVGVGSTEGLEYKKEEHLRKLGYTRAEDGGWIKPAKGSATSYQQREVVINDNRTNTFHIIAPDAKEAAQKVSSILDRQAKEDARKFTEIERVDIPSQYEPAGGNFNSANNPHERNQI